MKIQIVGGYTTKFGELWDKSPKELACEAVDGALKQADLEIKDINALYVGNMLSGILGGQEHLGAFAETVLQKNIPAFKIEGACASGGLAIHNATLAILSGVYSRVLVLGMEKMTDFKPEEIATALMGAGTDEERQAGATFPGLYALMARAYMEKYGLTERQMANVSVKNHYHASLNEKAQFRNPITVEQVMKSSYIARPLKLLDCSPVSDGAAAVILEGISGNERPKGKNRVMIEASVVATDSLGIAGRKTLTAIPAAKEAAQKAYKIAGIIPKDVDVCEVHDCFSIAEIMAMEDLGFYTEGTAVKHIMNGETKLSGKGPIVNTSGGLKGAGHPVGATGVKQMVEIFEQLSERGGKRQVKGAKIGLCHNVGGSGATAVMHILKKY